VSALTGPENDTTNFQFTAPVQPGNSGGPLLDASGHVVGIVVARLDETVKAQNVNFAIHAKLAERFLKANGITPVMAVSSDVLPPSEIAKRAKFYTYSLTCIIGN
jgi:serine protease Do